MHNTPAPSPDDLPSSRTLIRSTLIAAVAALVILTTVVLPAEYGVDPTGIGDILGLKEMGEIKVQLVREAAVADSIEAALEAAGAREGAATAEAGGAPTADSSGMAPQTASGTLQLAHRSVLSLEPGEGLEIKLLMNEGARANYSWTASGGVVNFDMHADNESIDYFSYETGSGVPSAEGELVAAFDGYHGWFWRNRTNDIVTVTLRTEGDYRELKMP